MGPGTLLGNRYEIEALIGRGGMGRVFRARDSEKHGTVAVKVLHRDEHEEAGRADRFRREIAILSRIDHPAVPAILHWGVHDGEHYFVSEFVDGVSLRTETARRGAWPPLEAAAFIAKLADALAVAHALGIVHRDLNPNNVMIASDGTLRLLDFGIARATGVDVTKLTTTGVIMGTPGYMSPEQFDARPIDTRTDIYSLGVVLFEMLAGRLPFAGQTPVAVALQHKTEPAPPVRSLRSEVPAWLERIVLRCLEKDPVRRFATAAGLARELEDGGHAARPRRRRLASGDHIIEDPGDHSDWALVLSAAGEKTGWRPGMALRFEERFYRLQQVEAPAARGARWTYRFERWPESDVFRGVVDYEQDWQDRAAEAATLKGRLSRWLGRS